MSASTMMTARARALAERHPEQVEAIGLLAERDPAGNGKYLSWEVKVLLSGRARAPEIADVVDLFHKHARSSAIRHPKLLRSDLYSYEPGEFTGLRDTLIRRQKEQDRKRARIERRYRVGELRAKVVYESCALIVRQIENKAAAVHYGLGARWCISMKGREYFEDYEAHNVVFFFLTRKVPKGDAFDRVAMGYTRDARNRPTELSYTDALDEPTVDMRLVLELGKEFLDVQRFCYESVLAWPPSLLASLSSGTLTAEGARTIYEDTKRVAPRGAYRRLLALACADATPADVLVSMLRSAERLVSKAVPRGCGRRHRRWPNQGKDILAAIWLHPSTPKEVADRLGRDLRRRHIRTDTIRIEREDGEVVGVDYASYRGQWWRGRRRWPREPDTVAQAQLRIRRAEAHHRRLLARLKKALALARLKKREKDKGKPRLVGRARARRDRRGRWASRIERAAEKLGIKLQNANEGGGKARRPLGRERKKSTCP